jgi:hypothetical protein
MLLIFSTLRHMQLFSWYKLRSTNVIGTILRWLTLLKEKVLP